MRTLVTFHSSAFNTSEERDYFLNPCCFGDDVCRWLIRQLRHDGIETDDEPGQEDFGWFFRFSTPEGEHCCVVGFRPGDDDHGEHQEGTWIAWLERTGTLRSLLGRRHRGVWPSAVQAIHDVLRRADEIRDIRWHERSDFDGGREENGSLTP